MVENRAESYFANLLSAGVLDLLSRLTPICGRVLDIGCGRGELLACLLERGISCSGCDTSLEAVTRLNVRNAGIQGWHSAMVIMDGKLPYEDASQDIIICMETLEHLEPAATERLLGEIHRILRPVSGRLLITTPSAELLARNMIYCPECRAVFHTVQHLRSIDATSIRQLMETNGFTTLLCSATDFDLFQRWVPRNPIMWSVMSVFLGLRAGVRMLIDALNGPSPESRVVRHRLYPEGPHLIWFGSCPSSRSPANPLAADRP
jgi:SAM-dependent methyltransferase